MINKQQQQQQTKPSQLTVYNKVHENGQQEMDGTFDLSKPIAAMNITKTIIEAQITNDTAMDRSLTRSNTFVCDAADDSQEKLLSVTHNVNKLSSNDVLNQDKQQQNKERTSKRSLSPIPNDAMNAAKRKSIQSIVDGKIHSGPLLVSTPRQFNGPDTANTNFSFFGTTQKIDTEKQQTFTLDNTVAQYEKSNNLAPDAVKLNAATKPTKQCNRMYDLMQTVVLADDLATEKCNTTQILITNSMDSDANVEDGTITKSNALNNTKNDDANLTKTILGKFNSMFLYALLMFTFFFKSFPL